MNLTIDNGEAEIQGFASLGVFTGGNLTASAINLLLENHDSGLIDGEASIFSTSVARSLSGEMRILSLTMAMPAARSIRSLH